MKLLGRYKRSWQKAGTTEGGRRREGGGGKLGRGGRGEMVGPEWWVGGLV